MPIAQLLRQNSESAHSLHRKPQHLQEVVHQQAVPASQADNFSLPSPIAFQQKAAAPAALVTQVAAPALTKTSEAATASVQQADPDSAYTS